MPAVHRWITFVVVLSSVGCTSPLGSEAGLPVPKDPGTIVVSVRDSGGNPIANVEIQVHDIPNTVGSTFSISQRTDSRGIAELTYVPAGTRRVEVKPSAGFRAAADSLIQSIDVIKHGSVSVAFVLERQ